MLFWDNMCGENKCCWRSKLVWDIGFLDGNGKVDQKSHQNQKAVSTTIMLIITKKQQKISILGSCHIITISHCTWRLQLFHSPKSPSPTLDQSTIAWWLHTHINIRKPVSQIIQTTYLMAMSQFLMIDEWLLSYWLLTQPSTLNNYAWSQEKYNAI